MKFIFLGSGKIAESFFSNQLFEKYIKKGLVAIVGHKNLLEISNQRYNFIKKDNLIEIGKKEVTENAIKKIIKKEKIDFVFSLQYPWILSEEFLELISYRVLNLHNASLPNYRGHNSISHEIINKETEHITTLHWVDKEVDRGKIFLTKIPIRTNDTAYSLWLRSINSAHSLINDLFEHETQMIFKQEGILISDGGKFYSKNQIEKLKIIRNNANIEEIDRISRAFWFPPHEPAYFKNGNRKLYILPNSTLYKV